MCVLFWLLWLFAISEEEEEEDERDDDGNFLLLSFFLGVIYMCNSNNEVKKESII